MQTPAERTLVEHLVEAIGARALGARGGGEPARLLNLGAGKSVTVEGQLLARGCAFVCDRVDVDNCSVAGPFVGRCHTLATENLSPLQDDAYDAVFANFVLEHVPHVERTAAELLRVVKPGGLVVVSIPNPRAPEFLLSRFTPLAFHRFLRGGTGWKTHYAYRSIPNLCQIFGAAGFETTCVSSYAFVSGYAYRFPVIAGLGRFYDRIVQRLDLKSLQGNVCAAFTRPTVSVTREREMTVPSDRG